jgi:PAS domain S-box-containing protein
MDFDNISGVYSKQHFFSVTHEMLLAHTDTAFAFFHFNIEKFRLINAFFGMAEGDRFIRYVAKCLIDFSKSQSLMTYGHIGADVFAFCLAFTDKSELVKITEDITKQMHTYPLTFNIRPFFGIAIVEDPSIDMNDLFDQASLAGKQNSHNYLQHYSFYEASLKEKVMREQTIINNMETALNERQFVVYLQPKYDLRTNAIDGAEALVRWEFPGVGTMSPGEFIPLFERNGFIMRLDYYIWEETCRILRKWLDEARKPCPISVNISRVDLFNPNLTKNICDLVNKYDIPPQLFQLELTESVYTSNPYIIKDVMHTLRQKGFTILMDDFGTGYSSLNVLKDIVVDILKIDMRFLSDCDTPGRGENILGSIVRMAKWLNLPVIAEGVETHDQVTFLKTIGCEYVQGYYFARPMPISDFENLAFTTQSVPIHMKEEQKISADAIWNMTSQLESLFSNILQAMALYEFDNENIELLRVNDAYLQLFGREDLDKTHRVFTDVITQEDYEHILRTFEQVAALHDAAECDFCRAQKDGSFTWVNAKLKYLTTIANKHVILASLSDITPQKMIELELQKYRSAISASERQHNCLLIIDDEEINRVILSNIFQKDFMILDAANARDGLRLLKEYSRSVDLILLDLFMPEIDGLTFLRQKQNIPKIADIPVIITTADSSIQQQNRLLEMGAKDYILKPFVPAVVRQRVINVLDSIRHMGEKLYDYRDTIK